MSAICTHTDSIQVTELPQEIVVRAVGRQVLAELFLCFLAQIVAHAA